MAACRRRSIAGCASGGRGSCVSTDRNTRKQTAAVSEVARQEAVSCESVRRLLAGAQIDDETRTDVTGEESAANDVPLKGIERFNRTLAFEWADARPYTCDGARAVVYPDWVRHYNHDRPRSGIIGQGSIERVHNLSASYS
jgi:transposase InsO family protein